MLRPPTFHPHKPPTTHLCIDEVCKVPQPLLILIRLKGRPHLPDVNREQLAGGTAPAAERAVALRLQVAEYGAALVPEGGAQKRGHCDGGRVDVGGDDDLRGRWVGGCVGRKAACWRRQRVRLARLLVELRFKADFVADQYCSTNAPTLSA